MFDRIRCRAYAPGCIPPLDAAGSARRSGVAILVEEFGCYRRLVHVAALCAIVICAAALAFPMACRSEGLPGRIVIASEGARPPYNYFDGDKLKGFEIDLGEDLCRRMAVSCTFVAHDWDTMIPDLLAHRYDAIMAAMEITPARSAQIAFTQPYVRMPSALLVRKSTDLKGGTPSDLARRTIGVEAGGPHQAYVEAIYPTSTMRRYASFSDAILDLEAGRVDAAFGDKDAVVAFLHDRRDAACCRILADVPRDPRFFGDGIAIGLRKGDTALLQAFNAALASAKADGTYASISARYFAFPID